MGLVHFDKAKQELALANTIDEVKDIRDKAEALRAYAKQAGESLEMQNMIAEIKIRAERKAGELLKEQEKNDGGEWTHKKHLSNDTTSAILEQPKTLKEIGISRDQSSTWQKIADIPEETFEKHITETKEAKEELTTASTLRLADKQIRQERDEKEKQLKEELEEIPLPKKLYDVIVIDPPWEMQKILRNVAPNQKEFDYPTMTIDEIKAFPVKDLMADNCHIFLWTTQKYLPYAFDILKEWGLIYVLTMVWHKSGGFQPFGLPQYNCEFVLYAHKGNPKFIDTKAFNCCFNGDRGKHSEKPDEFYQLLDRICDGNKFGNKVYKNH